MYLLKFQALRFLMTTLDTNTRRWLQLFRCSRPAVMSIMFVLYEYSLQSCGMKHRIDVVSVIFIENFSDTLCFCTVHFESFCFSPSLEDVVRHHGFNELIVVDLSIAVAVPLFHDVIYLFIGHPFTDSSHRLP